LSDDSDDVKTLERESSDNDNEGSQASLSSLSDSRSKLSLIRSLSKESQRNFKKFPFATNFTY
jgi:hypothetical protein